MVLHVEPIYYTEASIERKDEIVNFLMSYFVPDVPYFGYLNMNMENLRSFYDKIMPDLCSNGATLLAIDSKSDSVVGLAVNSTAETTDPLLIQLDNYSDHDSKFYRLMNKLRLNWLQRIPDCVKMLQIRILCVKPEFRGQQIGKTLVGMSLDKGREFGCNYVSASCVTTKSQNLFRSLNFKTLNIVKHEDYLDNNGEQIFPDFGDLDHVEWNVKHL